MDEPVYRASRSYELVLLDRLAPEERAALGDLADDPDLYGALRPRAGKPGTWKTVDRDTALLLLTLREPGPLPAYARREGGPGLEREIVALVLDGVLEIAAEGGRFVTGREALAQVRPAGSLATAGGGALGELSLAALRYAAALDLEDPRRLAARLYDYHRIPLSGRWLRRFPDSDSVRESLALGDRELPPGWRCSSSGDGQGRPGGWIVFVADGGLPRPVPAAGAATHKLYLSPRPEDLRPTVAGLLEVLPACPVGQLKIGADAAGLLRPDKIVLYCDGFEELAATASRLADRLAGVPVHGVPFTAEIAHAGLLSWGVDPPADLALPAWRGRESWRLWLCGRLASALVAGREAENDETPLWRFACERLALAGVDVDRWCPKAFLWRPEEA